MLNHKRIGILTALAFSVLVFILPGIPVSTQNLTHSDLDLYQPEPNRYLDRHRAARRIDSQRQQTATDLRKLGGLVANYGAEVSEAREKYDSIRERYTRSLELYYSQDLIEASELLDEVRDDSRELYLDFIEYYRETTTEILQEASENIVRHEMTAAAGQRPSGRTSSLRHNSQRLRLAHQQARNAEEMIRADRPDRAIDHFRIARVYGIRVIADLQENAEERANIEDKYQKELEDAGILSNTREEAEES